MMRMLISGGAGFLGSHLADSAIEKGIDVTIVDNLSTGRNSYIPRESTFIKERVEEFTTSEKFDYVIHLAARPSPEDYVNAPVSTLTSNSIGTKKMLDISKESNATFMYTSSSEVYGNASIIPTPETYYGYVNPNGVRSCYDEGKRFSEALAVAYFKEYGTDIRIQRPFNVYGPRIREDGQYGRVIPRFICWAIKGEPLLVHGDGLQTRSFLYIEDWLDATWSMLTNGNAKGKVFNVGSANEMTINALASMVIKLAGSNSRISYLPSREEDVKRRAADISLISKSLGWKPRVPLEKGIINTMEWFRERNE